MSGSTDDGPLVQLEIADHVATITLDSPSNRNALSRQLLADLHAALDQAADARVIVLTHTGTVFCSGADLKERRAGPVDATPMAEAMQRLMEAPQPTIAVLRGPARAGGIGLMTACDLVVADRHATFAFTEVKIGVAPAIISVPILRRTTWASVAAAFLTGHTFDAVAAHAMGLVTHVADDVAPLVQALQADIVAAAPQAVAATKQLLRAAANRDLAAQFAEMRTLSERLFSSAEAAEGMRAMAEGRPPRWT
jgi:enoyl-CoA hydratase/carnithine racemase